MKFFNRLRLWTEAQLAVESSEESLMRRNLSDCARSESMKIRGRRKLLACAAFPDETVLRRRRISRIFLCAVVFLLAAGVRLLHWQDNSAAFEQGRILPLALIRSYVREADRIGDQGSILFHQQSDEGDARMIVHPPGYPILIAALTNKEARSYTRLRSFQIIIDSLSATLVFLIAAEFLPIAAALIAGLMAALSPHLAYYSLWLTPESVAALPVLLAVYLLLRSPRLISLAFAGVCVGVACWLRANCLLLAPWLALLILMLFERGKKLRAAAVIVAAAFAVIAPITIRNYVIYGRFIPLSLGAGITLVEGIADYDTEDRFSMPDDDQATLLKDVEWHNRPDYAGNLWSPDGVERDRARFSRGLSVIRSNPGWFLGVMLRRAAFMLRYNDSGSREWPFGTAQVPIVSADPPFGHAIAVGQEAQPVWSASPADFFAQGKTMASEAGLESDGQSLRIAGDDSAFGDQFASAPVEVKRNTDYVLRISALSDQGNMAVKITDAERRVALASAILRSEKKENKKKKKDSEADESDIEAGPRNVIDMPFTSGDRDQARIVISNDGQSEERNIVLVGEAQLFEAGPTPHQWTRLIRPSVRAIQKHLFATSRLLPLIAAGVALMALARRKKETLCLLAVPLYYLCFQSALHTEYRYTMAIHYFLFLFAAVSVYLFGAMIRLAARRLTRREV